MMVILCAAMMSPARDCELTVILYKTTNGLGRLFGVAVGDRRSLL